MTDDLVRQLDELRRYADGLRGLLVDARDATPDHAEGTDRTGSVRAEIGPDALPARFQVMPDWRRRLAPDAFGHAVVEACQAAVGARLAGWTARLHRYDPARSVPRQSPGTLAPAGWAARSLGQITDDLLRAFDDLTRMERQLASPSGVCGVGAGGRFTLTLTTAGLTSCETEPRWTADQTGARLAMALADALADARSRLAAQPVGSPRPSTLNELDGLFAEVVALFRDPRRLAG